MLIDFHSHLATPSSIFCTDEPTLTPQGTCLLQAQGLLPQKWNHQMQETLIGNLQRNPNLQIGEVGLDKRFFGRFPLKEQSAFLLKIMDVAKDLNRTVSLHCVQQTGTMLEILKHASMPHYSLLWHGFTGSAETAKQLHSLGVLISIGPRFKGSFSEIAKANPDFVLETDYTGDDIPEHDQILEKLYFRCSSELDIPVSDLENHVEELLHKFTNAF